MTTQHVVVVGASSAACGPPSSCAPAASRAAVTVIGEERHLPYNRPPLSKEVLADAGDNDPGTPAQPRGVPAQGVDSRRRLRARRPRGRFGPRAPGAAGPGSGELVRYDGLVVATGLRPRRLALPGPLQGRHCIRTLDDCVGLRAEAAEPSPTGAHRPVVVVGAGFIGCETAATLVKRSCDVTVVEPFGGPMERVLGADLAGEVQRHHERAGVRFLLGVSPAAYTQDLTAPGRVGGLLLTNGTVLLADLVVESVGSLCNTEWLDGNGLDLSDGLLADDDLLVVGADRVVVVGDVAVPEPALRRRAPAGGALVDPLGHGQARRGDAAGGATGSAPDPMPFAPVPSFWSDQLGLRFQSSALPASPDQARLVEGDLDRLEDGVLLITTVSAPTSGLSPSTSHPHGSGNCAEDLLARALAVPVSA